MTTILDSEIPEDVIRHRYLGERFEIFRAMEEVKPKVERPYLHFSVGGVDHARIVQSVEDAFREHGWFGFADIYSSSFEKRSQVYGGVGLTYNPNYNLREIPVLAQVFGAPRVNLPREFFYSPEGQHIYQELLSARLDKEFFYDVIARGFHFAMNWLKGKDIFPDEMLRRAEFQKVLNFADDVPKQRQNRKNSYSDTYGFVVPSEVASLPGLSGLLGSCSRTLVRSRVAELKSRYILESEKELFWHRDDSAFFEMRVILTVTGAPGKFGLKIEGGTEFLFEPRSFYSWDTDKPHCQFAAGHDCGNRTNLILGVSPWIDFDPAAQTWKPNRFFGVKHPFDMLIDGDIFPEVEVCR